MANGVYTDRLTLPLAVAWLFYTGCRVSEAINARQSDVRWRAEVGLYEWVITNTKTHEPRSVWLPETLAKLLEQSREVNSPDPSWPVLWDCEGRGFSRVENPAALISNRTINNVLERARAAISLQVKLTAHVAKHSYCTNWIKEHKADEFAMEKLSRQVGTSPEVLRKTYVHLNITDAEWSEIRSFGARDIPFSAA